MKSRLLTSYAWPLVLAVILILGGCQSVQQIDSSAAGTAAESIRMNEFKLRELTHFQFTGGLGIWTDTESIPARIRWAQSDGDLNLNLTGPLGLGDLQLQDKSGVVILSRGKTVVTKGASPDDVIQRGLGLTAPVPIDELKQWVRGLPGGGSTIIRDSDGLLASLRYVDDSGIPWSVKFKRYEKVGELSLPALITASGGAYSVRLLLKNWTLTTNLSDSVSNEANKRLSIPGR